MADGDVFEVLLKLWEVVGFRGGDGAEGSGPETTSSAVRCVGLGRIRTQDAIRMCRVDWGMEPWVD